MAKGRLSNKWVKIVLIVAILGGIGYIGFQAMNQTAESSGSTVEAKEVKVVRGDITIGFRGDGEAEIPVVNLDFQLSGNIQEIYVKEGDQIEKGQILAKLDDTEYQNKLRTAEINYKKALANLEQKKENQKLNRISEKKNLDDLKRKLEQIETEYLPMLELQNEYSRQALDLKRIEYENAKMAYETQLERYNILLNSNIDLELEQANVESAEINLKMAREDLENTVLKSPLSATVLNISYKPGERFSPSSSSEKATADTSHFMVVSDSDKVEVVVPVSEIDLSKVKIGQTVEVTFEAYEKEIFHGKVISVDALPKIDNSGLVTYDVRIELDKGLDKIKSGMTCNVSFILRQERNVLIIPNKAVTMQGGKQIVKVKDEEEQVQIRHIKTGLTDGKYVAVTEGLNIGETLIIENRKSE